MVTRVEVVREGQKPSRRWTLKNTNHLKKPRARTKIGKTRLEILAEVRKRKTFLADQIGRVINKDPQLVWKHLRDVIADPERHDIKITWDKQTRIYTVHE